jgi:hypothetical protein
MQAWVLSALSGTFASVTNDFTAQRQTKRCLQRCDADLERMSDMSTPTLFIRFEIQGNGKGSL